ncbi:MAG: hypothetical protein PHS44_08280 [Candidatus Dojkabacteria bacterium]|nr:hypothetical protein [Candidatus Dojkabacteria bacterium]
MTINKKMLLWIILLFGSLVLLSYILVLGNFPGGTDAFWGSMPEKYLSPYYVSMLLSAFGYFIFTSFILVRIDSKTFKVTSLGYKVFWILYLFLLVPSALWTPLVRIYLDENTTLLWVVIRLVLILVGLATLGVLLILLNSRNKYRGMYYWLSVVSAVFFFFHTGILDAFVWPHYFRL